MWIAIPKERYLQLYTADHKIFSVRIIEDGLTKKLEVTTGIDGLPTLKHVIDGSFGVITFMWDETIEYSSK